MATLVRWPASKERRTIFDRAAGGCIAAEHPEWSTRQHTPVLLPRSWPTPRATPAPHSCRRPALEALSRLQSSCLLEPPQSSRQGTSRARCSSIWMEPFTARNRNWRATVIKAGLGHTALQQKPSWRWFAAAKVGGRAVPTQQQRSATRYEKLRTAAKKGNSKAGGLIELGSSVELWATFGSGIFPSA